MKYLSVQLFSLLILFMVTGCSYEIESRYCPLNPEDNNVILDFELKDENEEDIFKSAINTVGVFVFDENGLFHSSYMLNKEQLNTYQGIELTLVSGKYYVMAWANYGTKSSLDSMQPGESHYDDLCLDHTTTDNCDLLFYGPMTGYNRSITSGPSKPMEITVPQQGTVRKLFPLQYAHKKINVYVKDYRYNGTAALPGLQLTEVWRGYDFNMHALKDSPLILNQPSAMVETPEGNMAHASFVVTSFNKDNNISLYIKNPAGTSTYEVILNDYMNIHEINPETEVVISIAIYYNMDGSVQVKLPEWINQGIIPSPL